MVKSNPVNFVGDIHKIDYTTIYENGNVSYKDMVADSGRFKESLNGLWHYGIDQYDTCLRATWFAEKYVDNCGMQLPVDFSFDQWPTVQIPSCWNTQSERLQLYEGTVVYTRTFKYKKQEEERVLLRIGAANYVARVFLNGKFAGMHRGGSTPFFMDVTGLLEENNRILITVDNTRRPEHVPCENYDWFNYGGLYRDIELIRLPKAYIKDYFVRLVPDGCYNKIAIDVTVAGVDDGVVTIRIPELAVSTEVTIQDGKGNVVIRVRPQLWSPEDPKLYDVELCFHGDCVAEAVGFREIKTAGRDILLNGKPLYMCGISCHEESVGNGKAVSEAETLENLTLAKELGCNFMRLAHYPHSEKTARMADKLGIMLWEEIPVYWAIRFEREQTCLDAENQLLELILRDRNRASVIIWSVGNENADSDERLSFMSRLARSARKEDNTRLISAACMIDHVNTRITDRLIEHLDVIGVNEYCGWYSPDFSKLPRLFNNSAPEKPVIISEFGADAKARHRGTINDMGSEDCQGEVYRKQIETLRKISYVKGISPWILYDFRCPRRLHYLQDYYNTKGLCSADKSYKKQAFYILQQYYKERAGGHT